MVDLISNIIIKYQNKKKYHKEIDMIFIGLQVVALFFTAVLGNLGVSAIFMALSIFFSTRTTRKQWIAGVILMIITICSSIVRVIIIYAPLIDRLFPGFLPWVRSLF